MSLWNRRRLTGGAIDVDMGVASLRAGDRRARLERPQRVAHRGAAEILYFHADFNFVRQRQARKKQAIAFRYEADDRTGTRVQQAGLDQDSIHCRVEKFVIGDVVQMAVDVVVAPTRRHSDEACESRSAERTLALVRAVVSFTLGQPSLLANRLRP